MSDRKTAVRLSAQAHARGFYEKQGYRPTSGEYLVQHCPHLGRGQRDFKTVDGAARLGKKTEDRGRQGKENNSRPNEQENLQIRAKIVF